MSNTWNEPLPDITGLEPMAQAIFLADGFQLLVLNIPNESLARAAPRAIIKRAEVLMGEPIPWVHIDPYRSFFENPDAITREFLARNILDFLFHGEPPPSPPPSSPPTIDDILDAEEPSPPGRPRVWIFDLSHTPHEDSHQLLWDWCFKRFNEGRNTLMKAINANLILCLPPHIASFWSTSAPDFWSVRSSTVDLSELNLTTNELNTLFKTNIFKIRPSAYQTAHLTNKISRSIIHLTDLYFSLKNSSKISEIVHALTKDIETLKPEVGKPSLLVITGDLTQNTDPKEYARAFDWVLNPILEVLGLGREAVCIVPGNRDVDPKGAAKVGTSGELSLRDALDNDRLFQNILNDPFHRELYFQRMNVYRNAINAALGPPRPKQDRREWTTHRFKLDGQKVGVACFNSTWLSNAGLSNHDDKGFLALSSTQIKSVLNHLGDDLNFKIALLHHPFDWLVPHEADQMREFFLKNFNITLHGHWHHDTITPQVDAETGHVILPGAALQPTKGMRGYSILDLSSSRLLARRYNDSTKSFEPDAQSFPATETTEGGTFLLPFNTVQTASDQ